MLEKRENQICHDHDDCAGNDRGNRLNLKEELSKQQIQDARNVVAEIIHYRHINQAARDNAEELAGHKGSKNLSEVVQDETMTEEAVELFAQKQCITDVEGG